MVAAKPVLLCTVQHGYRVGMGHAKGKGMIDPQPKQITLREARKLSKKLGRLEPYRGYAYEIPGIGLLAHKPDGTFTLTPLTSK